jgi:hypothetical protein
MLAFLHSNTTHNLNHATEQLDDCCAILGLPGDAGVAAVRAAVFARLANGERAVGHQPEPRTDVLVRVQRLEAEGLRFHGLYRARRQVMGYNPQAEAIQNAVLEKIDDGAQAGRAWARFLCAQTDLQVKLAHETVVDVTVALATASVADEATDVEDLVSVPEAEIEAAA